jgi:tetratricopeptide (TPR) repeat protein
MFNSIPSVARALLLALAVLSARPAEAAPSKKDLREAKAAFAAGKRDFDAGRFEEAIKLYGKAYDLSALPAILFNIAQCHKKLSNWERASSYFQRYLELAPKPIANEQLARSLLAEVKVKLAEIAEAKAVAARAPETAAKGAGATAAASTGGPAGTGATAAASTGSPAGTGATAATSTGSPPASGAATATAAASTAPARPEKAEPAVVPDEALKAPDEDEVRQEGGGIATKWWLWTVVGAAVVAGSVTAAVVATRPAGRPAPSLGTIQF